MKSVAIALLALLGCSERKREEPRPAPPPRTTPVDASVAITGTTGPAELLPGDGGPMNPMTLADYHKELAGNTRVVIATAFPPNLSKLAGAGVNMHAADKNVSWVIDGEPRSGFSFIYDENANGNLGDDPRRTFSRVGDVWELAITAKVTTMFGEAVDAPLRLRFTRDGLFKQDNVVRRGTLPLPGGPMAFALVGELGMYGLDHQFVGFDLDRNGTLVVDDLDNAELFHVFEKTVTLDDASYALELRIDGSALALRKLAERVPARAPLTTGTPAPEIAVTDLDGKRVTLSGLRGKLVLIDFWATDCAPCVRALPELSALYAKYAAKGLEMLRIAMPSDDVRETIGNHRAGIEAIDEPAQTLYRVDRFPMYFLIDRDGTIACSRCRLDKVTQMIAEHLR